MGFGSVNGSGALGNASDVALNNASNNQVLTYDGTIGKWKNATAASGFADPTTTKGDLIVHGTSTVRLPVGSDGQILTADSTQTVGLKWATASGGAAAWDYGVYPRVIWNGSAWPTRASSIPSNYTGAVEYWSPTDTNASPPADRIAGDIWTRVATV